MAMVPPVDVRFDLWHLAFVNLIQRRAPPNFEVQSEVRLTIEPQRADMLLCSATARQRGVRLPGGSSSG